MKGEGKQLVTTRPHVWKHGHGATVPSCPKRENWNALDQLMVLREGERPGAFQVQRATVSSPSQTR